MSTIINDIILPFLFFMIVQQFNIANILGNAILA